MRRTLCQGTALQPDNLIDSCLFEVTAGDAKVRVAPVPNCLVETRVIDGRKYLLLPAQTDVEPNDFPVSVSGLEPPAEEEGLGTAQERGLRRILL